MHIFNVLEKLQKLRNLANTHEKWPPGVKEPLKPFGCYTCKAFYSRSTAELDGGEGPGRAVGVCEQVGNGDANGHDSHRVGVGLVKHGAQALDGLSSSQRSLHSIHRLQRERQRERKESKKGKMPLDVATGKQKCKYTC